MVTAKGWEEMTNCLLGEDSFRMWGACWVCCNTSTSLMTPQFLPLHCRLHICLVLFLSLPQLCLDQEVSQLLAKLHPAPPLLLSVTWGRTNLHGALAVNWILYSSH